jgi:hypothetical protein
MTDKVLETVEAVLAGKRMKFLDPNRKALLKLPPPALNVWMAYWMFENDAQEAYPTMATLMDITDTSENTIRKWRDYMVKKGWMIKLTGSAALRYIKPTNGSWNISVYRVNDPTSKLEGSTAELDGSNREVPQEMTSHSLTGQDMTVPNAAPNGASTGTSAFTGTTPVTDAASLAPTPTGEKNNALSSLRSEEPQKPEKQKPQFKCPACECSFRKESGLLDHVETEHTPDSPRYNPWELCEKCEVNVPRKGMAGHQLKCEGKSP